MKRERGAAWGELRGEVRELQGWRVLHRERIDAELLLGRVLAEGLLRVSVRAQERGYEELAHRALAEAVEAGSPYVRRALELCEGRLRFGE